MTVVLYIALHAVHIYVHRCMMLLVACKAANICLLFAEPMDYWEDVPYLHICNDGSSRDFMRCLTLVQAERLRLRRLWITCARQNSSICRRSGPRSG